MTKPLIFRQSVQDYGTDSFEESLQADIQQNTLALPLPQFCAYGGWPDETIEVGVRRASADAQRIYVTANLKFNEIIESYCCDHTNTAPVFGQLDLTIDKKNGEVTEIQTD